MMTKDGEKRLRQQSTLVMEIQEERWGSDEGGSEHVVTHTEGQGGSPMSRSEWGDDGRIWGGSGGGGPVIFGRRQREQHVERFGASSVVVTMWPEKLQWP